MGESIVKWESLQYTHLLSLEPSLSPLLCSVTERVVSVYDSNFLPAVCFFTSEKCENSLRVNGKSWISCLQDCNLMWYAMPQKSQLSSGHSRFRRGRFNVTSTGRLTSITGVDNLLNHRMIHDAAEEIQSCKCKPPLNHKNVSSLKNAVWVNSTVILCMQYGFYMLTIEVFQNLQ